MLFFWLAIFFENLYPTFRFEVVALETKTQSSNFTMKKFGLSPILFTFWKLSETCEGQKLRLIFIALTWLATSWCLIINRDIWLFKCFFFLAYLANGFYALSHLCRFNCSAFYCSSFLKLWSLAWDKFSPRIHRFDLEN